MRKWKLWITSIHYAKIDDSAYPKRVRDNLHDLFQSFKGIQDIQEHVFSIENPIARTYVGFDSIKHLKKAYNKFFHYVDTLRYGTNPKIFLKKKNFTYLYVEGKIDEKIETIVSNYFAADAQKDCTEYNGDRFHRNYSKLMKLNFFGFKGKDNYDKALNLFENNSIQYFRYHAIKSFINSVSDVPEEYLFYDSF